ncbi:hypothetical protein PHYBLDRAFT_59136 [Phycomyces blakesleeanus NRRL 1555(-)]|uniref:Uncharacterized protein n=1 Tax=Phycomyces blakesleeanus (strain ATCC 8743b / DSM 1359 / FGSC 10004 / NBRC 33097 / NRRL 1555) TaxID=763407 RepID=A0A162V597_PHYB8|nr:hypothetical protein PHYBLDRAFT_59136 [Phycomyces blakesleeanus NRRL 1555(-)]OAD80093.1 hypothetical protein PHYBLDRAFT_59136 [Phycomyces blakesleeanus NRRL 1555(-)]|eukprot:XP_018298133.1 hypothetical protein PHYBLDRAFT_59136 [Phycomyces blakesleeanus NRRL 1555(-)]
MSDINTTLLNSIQKIEVDLAEIKQALRELQRQFSNQFAPAVSAEDLTTMQQSIIEQSYHSVKAAKEKQEVVLELKAIEQKKECNRGKEGRLIFFLKNGNSACFGFLHNK